MKEFNFYFAGTQSKEAELLKINKGYNNLKSWFLELKYLNNLVEAKKNNCYIGKIMVDSGAFTAHRKNVVIDCDSYLSWLNDNEPYLECYVQLDHIPGKWGQKRSKEDILIAEKVSWENYKYMVSKLKNPYKLLAVFHQDENFENLKRILNFKINGNSVPYICISGAKDRTAQDRRNWYHECFQVIRESENKNVRVHCLGCSTYQDLSLFPFYSSDSTTWLQVAALGAILDKNKIDLSTEALTDASNANRLNILKPIIENNCKLFGLDFNRLTTDYKERSFYNIEFMNKWIRENMNNKSHIVINKRRLF